MSGILLNNSTNLASTLSTWGIHGLRISPSERFELSVFPGGITLTAPGGYKIKKGDNLITLPTILLNNAAALVEVSDELLDASASIRAKLLYSEKESTPTIRVLATEDTTIRTIAHISLLKGSYK